MAFAASVRPRPEAPPPPSSCSGTVIKKGQGPTSWPLTPSTSQDSVESSAERHYSTPSTSTDGLIPIANDVRLSTQSRLRRVTPVCRDSQASVASTVDARPPSRQLLRPARRLPPPLLAPPTTPPPSPPRDTPTSSSSCPAAFMNSAITDDREEETCPICLELLSLRLAGERPHVVPVCGHRLRTLPLHSGTAHIDPVRPC